MSAICIASFLISALLALPVLQASSDGFYGGTQLAVFFILILQALAFFVAAGCWRLTAKREPNKSEIRLFLLATALCAAEVAATILIPVTSNC